MGGRVVAKQLYLVRHARSVGQGEGRFLGATDAPLSEAGVREARALGEAVRRCNPERCYCSPLRRARETAEAMGFEAEVDGDLREADFGEWEGMTFEEIAAAGGEGVEKWAAFDADFAFPGGERLGDFVARVGRAAERLAAAPSERVFAVTHGGVIRAMICHLLGLDRRGYVLFEVAPASVTTIALYEGKGVLAGLNDVCHLEGV